MKIDQENFAQLVNKAMQVENVSHMRSVIEKELLHYDILFALEKGGLLDKLIDWTLRIKHFENSV